MMNKSNSQMKPDVKSRTSNATPMLDKEELEDEIDAKEKLNFS